MLYENGPLHVIECVAAAAAASGAHAACSCLAACVVRP